MKASDICRHVQRIGRPGALALGAALALAVAGCGGGGPEMARVDGTVSYKGEPLTAGVVSFISTDPERRNARGVIQPDGTYELQTVEPGDGAEVGEYKVAITGTDPEAMNTALPGEPIQVTNPLPPQYENPDTSGLTRTVESGRNTFDFDLE